jgi:signal transduction histidine kinase
MSQVPCDDTLQIYQKLVGISLDLASTLDLDMLLRRIVHVAADLCNAEAASILLFDDKKQQLIFQASTDIKNEEKMLGIVVPKESIAGWVALSRQPLSVANVHEDHRFYKEVETRLQFPTSSLIAVPMIVKEKLVGVLEVLNKRKAPFSDQDLEYLNVLGAQAAVAIENTRLFHQSDLISELVHELRTPLSSIITICYLLEKAEIPDEERLRLAHMVLAETQRLNDMATEFLDLSRLESGRSNTRFSTFSMMLLVKECCQVMQPRAAENNIEITADLPGVYLDLEADRDQIKQLILNLLSNAVKFNRPDGKILIRSWEENEKIYLEIKDTGLGMPADAIPRLFERFYRVLELDSVAQGTGLGLSICKRIVENHGGKISVFSNVGIGTSFIVQFPKTHFTVNSA